MSKVLNVLIVLVVICFLAFKFIFNRSVAIGETAPPIEATLLNGRSFELKELRGSYVLIDFWGSWCPPCRKANKKMVPFYQKYENAQFDSAEGFTIVSVAIEKKAANAKKAIEKDNLFWDHHIVQQSKIVLQDPLALAYGVTDLPTHILVNPEGQIMGVNYTIEKMDKILSQRLK